MIIPEAQSKKNTLPPLAALYPEAFAILQQSTGGLLVVNPITV